MYAELDAKEKVEGTGRSSQAQDKVIGRANPGSVRRKAVSKNRRSNSGQHKLAAAITNEEAFSTILLS